MRPLTVTAHDPLQLPATTLTWFLPAGTAANPSMPVCAGGVVTTMLPLIARVPGVHPVGGVRAAAPGGQQVAERAGLVPEGQLGVADAEPLEFRDVADERTGQADLARAPRTPRSRSAAG